MQLDPVDMAKHSSRNIEVGCEINGIGVAEESTSAKCQAATGQHLILLPPQRY